MMTKERCVREPGLDPARPRNAAATRSAILDAARRRFVTESYDDVGMRDVAGDVGVDAALVSRYFGSKEELFLEVLGGCGDISHITESERGTFGERIAEELVDGPVNQSKLAALLIMVRSASAGRSGELVRRYVQEHFYGPFCAWIGGPDATVRCTLASALMIGTALSRDLNASMNIDDDQRAVLRRRLAATLQALIDD